MKKIKRAGGQTVFDIAIQYCGDVQAAFEIADINNVSLTDSDTVMLEVPEAYSRRVVEYYQNNDIRPATARKLENANIIAITGEDIMTFSGENIITMN